MTTQDFPNPRDLRQHLARAESAPDPPPPPRHGPKIDLDALFRATLSEVW